MYGKININGWTTQQLPDSPPLSSTYFQKKWAIRAPVIPPSRKTTPKPNSNQKRSLNVNHLGSFPYSFSSLIDIRLPLLEINKKRF